MLHNANVMIYINLESEPTDALISKDGSRVHNISFENDRK